MSTAERTIIVAAVAGAIAIGLYVFQHMRAGDLEWRLHALPVVGIAGSLSVFVAALLLAPTWLPRLAIPGMVLFAGVYFLRTSQARSTRLAGWAFIAAGVAGLASLAFLIVLEAAS